jgi:hypothetical protein
MVLLCAESILILFGLCVKTTVMSLNKITWEVEQVNDPTESTAHRHLTGYNPRKHEIWERIHKQRRTPYLATVPNWRLTTVLEKRRASSCRTLELLARVEVQVEATEM